MIEIVPVAPIITGITFVFTFHMRCISAIRSLYCRIFLVSVLIRFLSPESVASINRCSSYIITDYDVRFIVTGGSVGLQSLVP